MLQNLSDASISNPAPGSVDSFTDDTYWRSNYTNTRKYMEKVNMTYNVKLMHFYSVNANADGATNNQILAHLHFTFYCSIS